VRDGPLKIHELKCWPDPFFAVRCGTKKYEIRKDDRSFCVGDLLLLREWSPETSVYTSRVELREVVYKTGGGEWGMPDGLCVLGIEELP